MVRGYYKVHAKLRTTSSVTDWGSEWEDTPHSGYFSRGCNFRVLAVEWDRETN